MNNTVRGVIFITIKKAAIHLCYCIIRWNSDQAFAESKFSTLEMVLEGLAETKLSHFMVEHPPATCEESRPNIQDPALGFKGEMNIFWTRFGLEEYKTPLLPGLRGTTRS